MDIDIKGLRVLVTAGGNGIGLAIVKSVVEAHQGTVRLAESAHGATFIIELPAEEST